MLVAALIAGQTAVAAYDVAVDACALDGAELTKLTALEMGSAGAPSLAVQYRCSGSDVTIAITNAETGIRVERVAEKACCSDVETERTLALLASGLFKAAETVLGHTSATPPEPAAPQPVSPAPEPQTMPVLQPDRPPLFLVPAPPPQPWPLRAPDRPSDAAPDWQHVVGLAGRVRAFNVPDAIVGYGVALDYRYWAWPSLAFGGFVAATFGSSEQTGGDVATRVVDFGAAIGWRFADISPFSASAELMGGASVVQLEGRAVASAFRAESIAGVTGMAGVALVPAVVFDRTILGVALEGGALLRAPRGEVDGEPAVQLDGLFLGAALRLSLGFARRAPRSPRGVAAQGVP